MNAGPRAPTTETRGLSLEDFRRVFDEHVDYVHHTLKRLGVPSADLDDAVQDAFVVLYRRRADYDSTRSIKLWLFGIALRVAAGRRRKRGPNANEDLATLVDEAPLADARLETERQRERVITALQSIGEDKRPVFIMHEVDGFTMPEIATELGIPLNTAYSRLRVARDEFRAAVQRQQRRDKS